MGCKYTSESLSKFQSSKEFMQNNARQLDYVKKCLHSELFQSVFPRIWTEYSVLRISWYSVRMRKNTDQNNPYSDLFWTRMSRMWTNTDRNVRIRSYSGPYFPAFGLNTERYKVRSIRSEYGKIRTRITPNEDTFYALLK